MADDSEGDKLDAAMEILHRIAKDVRLAPETVELQSGIVLKVKHVSETALRAVVTSVPKPEVPVVAMGADKLMEPWPEDPDYLEALNTAMAERNQRLSVACRVLGTECLSVPDGYSRPEEDDWLDALRVVGAAPDASSLATPMDRYATWLDNHAMSEFLDVNKITQIVLMRSAILEVEVMDAIRFFRRDGIGETVGDGELAPEDDDPDGDSVRAADAGVGDGD